MFSTTRRFSVSNGSLAVRNRPAESKVVARTSARANPQNEELADALPFFFSGAGGISNSARMTASGPLALSYLLTGIVPNNEDLLRRFYRDIYAYDTVSGACIDIMSTFPFSDYSLNGATKDQLEKFEESLFRINIRSLMPEISVNHLVDGAFCGTLAFNPTSKVFTDVLLHDLDRCRIENVPFYSADPRITVVNDEKVKNFLSSDSPYFQSLRKNFAASFLDALRADAYELSPLTTIFVPRRSTVERPITSILKRILPIYLLEKQLYRGTLTEAHKRQRAMFHVTAGDDLWEPTPEELDALTSIFQQAELDPLGAIVTTRSGVQASELRQGGDFWKWTDAADSLVNYKLRALGISEAFLSGDANFSNAETAVSVFMENMDAYRNHLDYKVIYNRIFPVISFTNGFFRDGAKGGTAGSLSRSQYAINNQRDLVIPKLVWHKKLSAKAEKDPFEVLEKLTEKEIPVPLRMWLAAGEVDFDNLVRELEEDKVIREKIAAFTGAAVGYGEDGKSGGGSGDEFASLSAAIKGTRRKIPLLARKFGAASEVVGQTKTGKPKAILNQVGANAALNRKIADAVVKMRDPSYRAGVKANVKAKFGRFPKIM